MKKVAFVAPAVADVGAVEHVGDDDGFDAGVGFAVGFFHRGAGTGDHERVAVPAGDFPVPFFELDVPEVDAFHAGFGKNDDGIFREFAEGVEVAPEFAAVGAGFADVVDDAVAVSEVAGARSGASSARTRIARRPAAAIARIAAAPRIVGENGRFSSRRD